MPQRCAIASTLKLLPMARTLRDVGAGVGVGVAVAVGSGVGSFVGADVGSADGVGVVLSFICGFAQAKREKMSIAPRITLSIFFIMISPNLVFLYYISFYLIMLDKMNGVVRQILIFAKRSVFRKYFFNCVFIKVREGYYPFWHVRVIEGFFITNKIEPFAVFIP